MIGNLGIQATVVLQLWSNACTAIVQVREAALGWLAALPESQERAPLDSDSLNNLTTGSNQ